jgi:outer membrane protein
MTMHRILGVLSVMMVVLTPVLWGQGAPQAKPKAALVDIQELFREYHKSIEAEKQINIERARIQKENNDMRQRIRVLDMTLREINRTMRSGEELTERKRKSLMREAGLLFQEREGLDRQRKQVMQSQHQELNRRMIGRMKAILKEIREIVVEKAERGGYDYVFDSAGLNTSQVPFVLYAKEATDMTPMILKELNKDAPSGE